MGCLPGLTCRADQPAELDTLGGMVAARYPRELVPLMKKAGGTWEPGSRRWLIERRRIGPLVRALRRATDPLFRQAGDGAGRRRATDEQYQRQATNDR